MAQLYVFAPLRAELKLAGYLKWEDESCKFSYAAPWLGDTTAYALDPRNLPMRAGEFVRTDGRLHGVFADSTPDRWGRSLAELFHHAPLSPRQLLRLTNGAAVGGLRYGLAPDDLDAGREHARFEQLAQIEHAAWQITSRNAPSDREIRLAFGDGCHMGGCRPKSLVFRGESEWIAKFARDDDDLDVARNEWACMQVARLARVDTPRTEVVEVNGRSVLLVERFDRPTDRAAHYLSMSSLLGMGVITASDFVGPAGDCTYGGLAQMCLGLGVENAGEQLFRRMLVNLAVGNGDDHLRNHGLLCFDGRWQLAPAFDITSTGGIVQSVGVGVKGRLASLDNAMSDLERFGLSMMDAEMILEDVRRAVAAMPTMLKLAEASPADVSRTMGRMRTI